jgi:hypothetical protein
MASAECAQYGAATELSGTVSHGKWWLDDHPEDKREFVLLALDAPICLDQGADAWSPAQAGVDEIQIVGCIPTASEGERVTLRGVLEGESLMSHRRPVLLVAECR